MNRKTHGAGSFVVMSIFAVACGVQSSTQPTASAPGLRTASPAATAVVSNASASPVNDANSNAHMEVRAPLTFTLSGCSALPPGLIVSGSGNDHLVINTSVDGDAVTHIQRNDLVTGTAEGSDGASYLFNYHNHSTADVPAGGFPWSLETSDHFNLVGNGRANQMQVHFVLRATFSSPIEPPTIEIINVHGDPITCDPI